MNCSMLELSENFFWHTELCDFASPMVARVCGIGLSRWMLVSVNDVSC